MAYCPHATSNVSPELGSTRLITKITSLFPLARATVAYYLEIAHHLEHGRCNYCYPLPMAVMHNWQNHFSRISANMLHVQPPLSAYNSHLKAFYFCMFWPLCTPPLCFTFALTLAHICAIVLWYLAIYPLSQCPQPMCLACVPCESYACTLAHAYTYEMWGVLPTHAHMCVAQCLPSLVLQCSLTRLLLPQLGTRLLAKPCHYPSWTMTVTHLTKSLIRLIHTSFVLHQLHSWWPLFAYWIHRSASCWIF